MRVSLLTACSEWSRASDQARCYRERDQTDDEFGREEEALPTCQSTLGEEAQGRSEEVGLSTEFAHWSNPVGFFVFLSSVAERLSSSAQRLRLRPVASHYMGYASALP